MSKITKAADGTLAEVETTFTDDLVAAVVSPLSAMDAEPTEFVSPRVAGIAAIGYGMAGIWTGDKYGEKIPVLGGRRI